jgi:hypothetical protein
MQHVAEHVGPRPKTRPSMTQRERETLCFHEASWNALSDLQLKKLLFKRAEPFVE